MPIQFQRHPLFVSFLIVLPAVVYALVWTTPHFETNDDVWMMLTLSGRVTSSEPTPFVFFMNFFLCHELSALYRIAGGVPWYGLMHLGGILFALWMMAYALVIRECSLRQIWLFLLCLITLGLPFLVRIQFTKTASLMFLGGLFLLDATFSQQFLRRASPRQTWGRLIGVVILFVVAFMVREASFVLMLAVSVPVLLHLFGRAWRAATARSFFVTVTSIAFLLFAIDYGHKRTYAQDPEWQRFSTLVGLKGWFLEFDRVSYNAESKKYFDAVGWSENDYYMLKTWFYIDPVTYSPEKFMTFLEHFPVTTTAQPVHLKQAAATVWSRLKADGVLWAVLPLLLGISFLCLHRFSLVLLVLATTSIAFLVMTVLLAFFHLPERVYQPTVMATCWLALLVSTTQPPSPGQPRWTKILNCCGGICVGFLVLSFLVRHDVPLKRAEGFGILTIRDNLALRTALSQLQPHPSQTFISWGGAFPYQAILPFERTDYLADFKMVSLGAINQAPIQRQQLNAQGITDLPHALFARDDVFITFFPNTGKEALLTTYIEQHYGIHVSITEYFHDRFLAFWRITRVNTDAVSKAEHQLRSNEVGVASESQ